MTPQEIEAKLKSMESNFDAKLDATKKEYDLKLDAASKDAANWKTVAEQSQADAKKFQEEVAKQKKEKDEIARKSAEAENKVFVEKLKESGKVVPAQEEFIVKLMGSMSQDSEVLKFKEADGSETSHTQLSLFKKFLESLEPRVSYDTFSGGSIQSKLVPDKQGQEQFMTIKTKAGDQTLPIKDADLATKVFEYMEQRAKENRPVTYEEALIAVSPKRKIAAR